MPSQSLSPSKWQKNESKLNSFQVPASDSELDFDAQLVVVVRQRIAVLLREDCANLQGGRDEGGRRGEVERRLSHEQGINSRVRVVDCKILKSRLELDYK